MSWTNGHPSPAEHIIWPLGTEPVYSLFDGAHVRRIVKRAAPFLSSIAAKRSQIAEKAPEVAALVDSIVGQLGLVPINYYSNGTFTVALIQTPQFGPLFGVASRMETDREDVRVAKRIAGARALHALLFQIEQARLVGDTEARVRADLAAEGIQLEE